MIKKYPLDELSTALGRIMGLLLTEEKVDHAVQHLSRAVKDSIPGTLGAGVSILDSQARQVSSGSADAMVKRADALQYELGRGPASPPGPPSKASSSTTSPQTRAGRTGALLSAPRPSDHCPAPR